MESLPDQLLVETLTWVAPMDLLLSASRVSNRFADVIQGEHFWKLLAKNLMFSSCHRKNNASFLTQMQLQRYCLLQAFSKQEVVGNNDDSRADDQVKENDKRILKTLEFGSILPTRDDSFLLRKVYGHFRTCLASTTDQENEFIENVIRDNLTIENYSSSIRLPRRATYWSSKPSGVPESNETLLFTTKYPDSLVSKVCIKPLQDPYIGDRCYTWKNISIKAYRLSAEKLNRDYGHQEESIISKIKSSCVVNRNTKESNYYQPSFHPWNNADDGKAIDEILTGKNPVYESVIFETISPNSVEWQQFDFPNGVIANVIVINLIGKNSRQFDYSGYYVCAERVVVQGIPLYKNREEKKAWNTNATITALK